MCMAKYNTKDFWTLLQFENALPLESSLYVQIAIDAAIVGNYRAIFGFDVEPASEVRWDHVEVPRSVPLSLVAKAANTDKKTIERLNPQLRRGRTPPGVKNYRVRVPRGSSTAFAQRFPQMRGDWDGNDAYVVRHGERFEDIATRHPAVSMAAVVAAYHDKWDERPLLVLTLKEGETVEKQEILDFLEDKIVKWWMPDDVIFIDEMPMTATGKIRKLNLREAYRNHLL